MGSKKHKKTLPETAPHAYTVRYVVISFFIVLVAVVLFFVFKKHSMNTVIPPTETAYAKTFDAAEKDFVCPDGSFFSFSTDPKIKGEFEYYPTPAEAADITAAPGTTQPPWFAGISVSGVGTSLALQADTEQDYETILAQLATCKNTDGRTANDLYKVTEMSIR